MMFGLVSFMALHACTTACSCDGQAVGCKRHPLGLSRGQEISQFPNQRCPRCAHGPHTGAAPAHMGATNAQ